METLKKDPNIRNDIPQTIQKYNKESFATRSQVGQNAQIQNKVFSQATLSMGETISDMDMEIEQKFNQNTYFKI